jgi:cytochrome c-type biogenesis protein CcmE
MPKDVAEALKKQGHWKDDYGDKSQAAQADQSAANPRGAGATQGVSQ